MPTNNDYQPLPTSEPPYAGMNTERRGSNADKSVSGSSSHLIDIPTSEDIQELVTNSVQAVTTFWDDFKEFVGRGPAVDLGVGMMLGTAFTSIINSFMTDILTPPIGLIVGSTLDEAFIELRHGQTANITYHTVQEAIADGAVTINIGRFASQLLTFILISLILYWTIKTYEAMKRQIAEELKDLQLSKAPPATIKRIKVPCPECDEMISENARRCPFCTSQIVIK